MLSVGQQPTCSRLVLHRTGRSVFLEGFFAIKDVMGNFQEMELKLKEMERKLNEMENKLREIEKKADPLIYVVKIFDKHSVFIKVLISVTLGISAFLIYTYERSFRVHQETLQRVLKYNTCDDAKKIYIKTVHVGHDGTTLEAAPFPKEVGLAGTKTPLAPESVTTANSPLEQFDILSGIPMNIGNLDFSFTNPSLSMLLTLSLVLLLVHFVTKNGRGS